MRSTLQGWRRRRAGRENRNFLLHRKVRPKWPSLVWKRKTKYNGKAATYARIILCRKKKESELIKTPDRTILNDNNTFSNTRSIVLVRFSVKLQLADETSFDIISIRRLGFQRVGWISYSSAGFSTRRLDFQANLKAFGWISYSKNGPHNYSYMWKNFWNCPHTYPYRYLLIRRNFGSIFCLSEEDYRIWCWAFASPFTLARFEGFDFYGSIRHVYWF